MWNFMDTAPGARTSGGRNKQEKHTAENGEQDKNIHPQVTPAENKIYERDR